MRKLWKLEGKNWCRGKLRARKRTKGLRAVVEAEKGQQGKRTVEEADRQGEEDNRAIAEAVKDIEQDVESNGGRQDSSGRGQKRTTVIASFAVQFVCLSQLSCAASSMTPLRFETVLLPTCT